MTKVTLTTEGEGAGIPDKPAFIPGLILNRRFYHEVVQPILERHLPTLEYSAALIGYGSDVLGYDTPMSTDHNWGPRLQLFLSKVDYETHASDLNELLRHQLPPIFAGYSVHFSEPDIEDNGTRSLEPHQGGPVNHMLWILTLGEFANMSVAIDPDKELSSADWLLLPEQKLLEVTSGEVFYDGLGTLEPLRARLSYYPDDIWKLRLAAQWQRIAEEEAFAGRTGDLGDEVGSWIVAARLARNIMLLSFHYARRYAPYSKWLGTAFSQLPIAGDLLPHLRSLTTSTGWRERETHLVALYTRLADEHNQAGITKPISTATQGYFGRPYQVLFAGRFAEAIVETIEEPSLRTLAPIGAVDQFTDNVAFHSDARLAAKLKSVFPRALFSTAPNNSEISIEETDSCA